MVFEFKLPDIGEGLEEGEIVKWLVKEGDSVKEDQNIVQVETDKSVADLPSPKSGKILRINFKAGDIVKVGQTLCEIGSEGEKASKKTGDKEKKSVKEDKKSKEKPKKKDAGSVVGQLEEAPEEDDSDMEVKEEKQSAHMTGESQTNKVLAAPAVRKKAMEMKIDLSKVKGSGDGGRVLMKDLGTETKEEVPQQGLVVKKKYDEYGYVERIPLKGIRKTIAKNMMASLEGSAQLTAMEDAEVTRLWDIRNKEKKVFEKKGIKLTLLPFIVKAVVGALKENPILNSTLENEEIVVKKYFNIGVAVETEVGLMVPVIKIAEKKSVSKIAKEINELAEKAKARKIDAMEMQGGSFTITNYGSVGGTYATPVINPGESAILGIGRVFERAVLVKNKVKNVKIMPLSLTFDHRVIDGAQAARFLESFKRFIEDPDHLFVEID